MTDARLRELETRWRYTGSPEDEARYLLERVRVGDLRDEQLVLAALFGSEASRLAVGEKAEFRPPSSVEEIVSLLLDGGAPVLMRAALTVARLQVARAPTDFARRAVQAIERLLACPCARHGEAAKALCVEARGLFSPHEQAPDTPAAKATWSELGSSWFALETVTEEAARQHWDDGTSWRDSKSWRRRHAVWPTRAVEAAATACGVEGVFAGLASELVPWMLRNDVVSADQSPSGDRSERAPDTRTRGRP